MNYFIIFIIFLLKFQDGFSMEKRPRAPIGQNNAYNFNIRKISEQERSKTTPYDKIGSIRFIGNHKWNGSGTLMAPNLVLSCAHNFVDQSIIPTQKISLLAISEEKRKLILNDWETIKVLLPKGFHDLLKTQLSKVYSEILLSDINHNEIERIQQEILTIKNYVIELLENKKSSFGKVDVLLEIKKQLDNTLARFKNNKFSWDFKKPFQIKDAEAFFLLHNPFQNPKALGKKIKSVFIPKQYFENAARFSPFDIALVELGEEITKHPLNPFHSITSFPTLDINPKITIGNNVNLRGICFKNKSWDLEDRSGVIKNVKDNVLESQTGGLAGFSGSSIWHNNKIIGLDIVGPKDNDPEKKRGFSNPEDLSSFSILFDKEIGTDIMIAQKASTEVSDYLQSRNWIQLDF